MITKKFDRDIKRIRNRYAGRCDYFSAGISNKTASVSLHFGPKNVLMVMIQDYEGTRLYDHKGRDYTALPELFVALENTIATLKTPEAA